MPQISKVPLLLRKVLIPKFCFNPIRVYDTPFAWCDSVFDRVGKFNRIPFDMTQHSNWIKSPTFSCSAALLKDFPLTVGRVSPGNRCSWLSLRIKVDRHRSSSCGYKTGLTIRSFCVASSFQRFVLVLPFNRILLLQSLQWSTVSMWVVVGVEIVSADRDKEFMR